MPDIFMLKDTLITGSIFTCLKLIGVDWQVLMTNKHQGSKNALFSQIWKTSAVQSNMDALESAKITGAPQFAALIESLILHPTTHLPTNNFVEFIYLANLFGLRPLQRLIEAGRLKFVFVPHILAYLGGAQTVREITVMDKNGDNPRSTWKHVEPAANAIGQNFNDPALGKEIAKLLINHSERVDLTADLDEIYNESRAEFRSALKFYKIGKSENLKFKIGDNKVQLFLGGLSLFRNPKKSTHLQLVDHLLAFYYANLELKIAGKLGLGDISSSALSRVQSDAKIRDMKRVLPKNVEFYHELRQLRKIPDLGGEVASGQLSLDRIVDLVLHRDCDDFQDWFHRSHNETSGEISRALIELIEKSDLGQITTKKVLKYFAVNCVGIIPLVGWGTSAIEEFVAPRFKDGYGARLFMDRMVKRKWSTPSQRKSVFDTNIQFW